MSEAYERERQNNARLDELASKVSALRGVTVDIYENARDHQIIDDSNEVFTSFTSNLKQSAGRLRLMASTANRTQTLRLAGIICAIVFLLYLVWGWIF
ncbi:hypothetical protein RUND412_000089 [Rhizina undulata]